ncbi:MAG TPA: cupin domain-containing protein [Rhizomicrobium sp.]|jgi:quercetin dioxygenase-like cupin family protein
MRTSIITVATLLIAQTGLAQYAARAQEPGTTRTALQRHDLSIPGKEVIQTRVSFDPGAVFGKHTHPGEELVYVAEGSMEYQIEGKSPMILKAGDVLFIPPGTVHSVKNTSTGNSAELSTYIVEKGKPLVTMVK